MNTGIHKAYQWEIFSLKNSYLSVDVFWNSYLHLLSLKSWRDIMGTNINQRLVTGSLVDLRDVSVAARLRFGDAAVAHHLNDSMSWSLDWINKWSNHQRIWFELVNRSMVGSIVLIDNSGDSIWLIDKMINQIKHKQFSLFELVNTSLIGSIALIDQSINQSISWSSFQANQSIIKIS